MTAFLWGEPKTQKGEKGLKKERRTKSLASAGRGTQIWQLIVEKGKILGKMKIRRVVGGEKAGASELKNKDTLQVHKIHLLHPVRSI